MWYVKITNKQTSQNQNQNQNPNKSNANKNGNSQFQKKNGNGNGNGKGNGNGGWKGRNKFPPCEHCQYTNHSSDRCSKKHKQNEGEASNGKPQKFSNSAKARKNTNSAQIADSDEYQDEQNVAAASVSSNNSFQLHPYHLNC